MVRKGVGCLMFKRDLKRYYRQIFVDPVDAVKLGNMFDENVMIWKEFLGYQIFLLYLSNTATTLVVHELRF